MPIILNHEIGPVGYGLMGLTRPVDPMSYEDCFAAMDAAFASGANYWNGGEFYGTPQANCLHLLHAYFTNYPERASQIVLCIKGSRTPGTTHFDGTEKGVRRSVDECVRVLDGKKKLDIFECARVDPDTPIEETIRVLGELIKEGKFKGIGLSEVKADTIRRAIKVHPIAQVEVELSLWSTDILHNGVAATCAEFGIPIIAYAPLSRGGLSGTLQQNTTTSDLPEHLRRFPRFQEDALQANLQLTNEVAKLAKQKGVAVPQIAIAWVRAQSGRNGNGVIIPLPGAEKPAWVRQNCEDVRLTEEELLLLEDITRRVPIKGQRYNGVEAKFNEG
ncbi:Pyridoxine 4-dehydrogenase [Hypocenomyce scalaris]|nr:Pyridoxine 4-dehydrogenase [Hypocenomyce scalaris]